MEVGGKETETAIWVGHPGCSKVGTGASHPCHPAISCSNADQCATGEGSTVALPQAPFAEIAANERVTRASVYLAIGLHHCANYDSDGYGLPCLAGPEDTAYTHPVHNSYEAIHCSTYRGIIASSQRGTIPFRSDSAESQYRALGKYNS